LARADQDGTYDIRVGPMLVPEDHHLGQVNGAFNGVELHGDFVGEVRLFGQGAGMIPTASAVAADVIDIAHTIVTRAETIRPAWPNLGKMLPLADTSTVEWRYCVRVPGVKRGRKKLLVETLRACYADAEEVFRVSAEGDFTVALTGDVREANARRAVEELRKAVESPDDVYAIPLLDPSF
jgi:hypothetical protein